MNNIVACRDENDRLDKISLSKKMILGGYKHCRINALGNVIYYKKAVSREHSEKLLDVNKIIFRICERDAIL